MRAGSILDLGPMAHGAGLNRLTADWLQNSLSPASSVEDAATSLRDAAGQDAIGGAPAWIERAWFESWSHRQLALQPDERSRDAASANLRRLAAGEASVIVTGQQPGFLGGPLYTLYKVATAVALAERRSAAGHPTVPLFWCGDDDDDLAEAYGVTIWDPRRATFLKPVPPESPPGSMVGAMLLSEAGGSEASWLQEQTGALAVELSHLLRAMTQDGRDRGDWQRALMARLFAGRGLLSVSGNDGAMIAVAEPFLRRCSESLEELTDLVRARGAALDAAGYHAQIAEASLGRPFQAVEGRRRFRCEPLDAAARAASTLRPGLLLRSPVQDWLFRPAAVVVGPGEKAYLEQLRPLYEALELPRAPLVPRLFATLGCEADGNPGHAAPADPVPGEFAASTTQALAEALARAGSPVADDRAAGLFARWRPALARAFAEHVVSDGTHDPQPWHAPRAGRQERILPVAWAAALWGEPLVDQVLAVAHRHLDEGAERPIADWGLCVPEPPTGDTP